MERTNKYTEHKLHDSNKESAQSNKPQLCRGLRRDVERRETATVYLIDPHAKTIQPPGTNIGSACVFIGSQVPVRLGATANFIH